MLRREKRGKNFQKTMGLTQLGDSPSQPTTRFLPTSILPSSPSFQVFMVFQTPQVLYPSSPLRA